VINSYALQKNSQYNLVIGIKFYYILTSFVTETIWQDVLPVLEEAQHMPMPNTRMLLSRFLWQQRFGRNAPQALYTLLVNISQQFPLAR
jgi:hypothetical protein